MTLPIRKANRLKNYDYNLCGSYFITICVKERHAMLSNISGPPGTSAPTVTLSEYGIIVEHALRSVGADNLPVSIDTYCIMPDHVHFILTIVGGDVLGAPDNMMSDIPQIKIVPSVITWLKKIINKQIGFDIWQRSYYDHIIRDEDEYWNVYQYIQDNPAKWLEHNRIYNHC